MNSVLWCRAIQCRVMDLIITSIESKMRVPKTVKHGPPAPDARTSYLDVVMDCVNVLIIHG